MELLRSNQLSVQAQREKSWLSEELEMRNKAFQEDRARDCQEMLKFQRICCAEAERARQLRIDELSMQQKENPSSVNQLTVQIQELQDKVNALTANRDTASSSGLSHVLCQPMSIPSLRGMTCRDSCLQLGTRYSLGTSGHV